ncbi:MAG: hypothetical protein KME06_09975 [Kastovskya adunca ATA6-11-RM4]|nr:hypothetical protein [Kastovskya adunca ATA6-11-RM4]
MIIYPDRDGSFGLRLQRVAIASGKTPTRASVAEHSPPSGSPSLLFLAYSLRP